MSNLTRRALLRRGAVGGGSLAAISLLGGNRFALATDDDAEVAMRAYFGARFRAIDSGDAADRRAAIDHIATENGELRDFVDRDIQQLSQVVRSYGPILGMQHEIQVTGRQANTFFVREGPVHSWANDSRGSGPSADPRKAPDRRPVIQSGIGYIHTLKLDRASGRFRVHADAFRGLGWDSPDVKRLGAALPIPMADFASHRGLQSLTARGNGGGRLARPLAASYFWDQAVNYCYTYNGAPGTGTSYNPYYHNYNPYGGDCTSFISQALANAGWTAGNTSDPNAYWYDAALPPLSEGAAWYNNNPQRNWILANARGAAIAGSPQNLSRGDVVYYDWNASDGTLDHTAMVTTIPGSGRRLIDCHNPDLHEQDWETVWAPGLSPFSTVNMSILATY